MTPQELVHTLHHLLKRRKSKASTTDLEKFIAEHSMSLLKTELLDVLDTILSNLNTFSVYNVSITIPGVSCSITCSNFM